MDGGSNVSVVTLGLIKALGLKRFIFWKDINASSWNDTSCTFKGHIFLTFNIAGRKFNHKFLIAEKLATRTPAILGKDFLQKSEATLEYTADSVKVTIRDGKGEIPLVKASEKIVTLNVVTANEGTQKTKYRKSTFVAKREIERPANAWNCEAKKIEPIFGSIIRVVLEDRVGSDWPALAHIEYGEPAPGLVVESQMITVKRHQATAKSRHAKYCKPGKCVRFCPTRDYVFAHAYVFNSSSETAYLEPEAKIAVVEPIWELQQEKLNITKSNNTKATGNSDAETTYKRSIEEAARKLRRLRQRSAERKKTEQSATRAEHEEDPEERREVNYLHLDPEKDEREYRRQYIAKHHPKMTLDERRRKVRQLIREEFADIHPIAKKQLEKYPETVHIEGVPFVGVKTVEHRIDYKGPVYFQKQYKTPKVLEEDIVREIDKLLKEDLIEGSDSGYSNPYLPIVKKDEKTGKNKVRLTIDMRRLNEGVTRDLLPIGDVQDLLNELNGSKYLTVIDAAKGYLQVNLDEDSKKFTAFRHKNMAYQFKRMCFGLANAPATWCRLVQTALSGVKGVYAYMDDLLLHSSTLEDHQRLIEEVLKRLSYHGIEISMKKCQWVKSSVEYLGFRVTSEGLRTHESLLGPMLKLEVPKTLEEARSLISTFSFYRRFIRNFSDIAHPLIQLTKGFPVGKGKNIKVEATPECQEALETLKEKLRENVVLKYPDFSKKFIINTDASLRGIGGQLSQLDSKGHPRPLAFVSRSLSLTESRYPVVELEALALVYALKQFRHIILGYDVELVTDHRPLVYLFRHVDPSSRLYRYQLAIQEYNVSGIQYLAGEQNVVSDYLSRWTFQPDEGLSPAITCTIHSPLAATLPPSFDYERCQRVEVAKGNVIAFTGSTRNTQWYSVNSNVPDHEGLLHHFYRNRKAVSEEVPVATKDTSATLGQIQSWDRDEAEYVMCFTNVFETPEVATEKQQLAKILRENEVLQGEGFKFQLRNDRDPVRDYYYMLCVEELTKKCIEQGTKKLQLIWPRAREETSKRISHISNIIRHCAYELWQNDIKCEVIGQPEIEEVERDMIVCAINTTEAEADAVKRLSSHLEKFQEHQQKDEELKKITAESKDPEGKERGEYSLQNGLLYKLESVPSRGIVRRLCVPQSLRREILEEYHDNDHHPGIAKTHYNCRSQCYWRDMLKDVKAHINECTICAQAKYSNNTRVMEGHLVFPPKAGHTYAIDIVGSLPKAGLYQKILVIVCTFSRFTTAVPLQAGTSAEVINALEKVLPLIGYPEQIVSDNAGNFTSELFLNYLKKMKIEHQLTTPYTPTGNALAERSIRSVLSLLRVMCANKPSNWYSYLGQVCSAINSGFNLTINERPHFLFFGRDPPPKLTVLRNHQEEVPIDEEQIKMRYAQELVEQELQKDRTRRDRKLLSSGRLTSYKIGDVVYLQRRFIGDRGYKLKYPYIGPFRVEGVAGNTVVLTSLATGKTRRANMRHLKIFKNGTLTRTQNKNVDTIYPGHEEISAEDEAFEGIAEPTETESSQEGEPKPSPNKEPEPPPPERITPRYALRSRQK